MGDFLTQLWPLGAAVLVVLAAGVLAALIVVLVRVAKTMKNVNVITQEAEEKVTPALKRIDPLVDRVELTVDTLNLELLRVDGILEDVESVTDVAGKTADTVSTITTAPTDAVASVVDRVRGALTSRRKNREKEGRFVYPIGAGEAVVGGKHSATATSVAKGAARPEEETSSSAVVTSPAKADAEPTYEDLKRAAASAAGKIEGGAAGDPDADAPAASASEKG